MIQDHCKIQRGLCSVPQAAATGTAGAAATGATAGGAPTGCTAGGATTGCTAGGATTGCTAGGPTTGCTAGVGTGRRTAPGPKFGRTPGRLRTGLSALGGIAGLPLGLLSAFTNLGLLRRSGRTRPGLRGRVAGGFTSAFCGSASTTQARATRAKSTCKTGSKILV